jgi:hypothetical protein
MSSGFCSDFLLIGGLQGANREIGVPGRDRYYSRQGKYFGGADYIPS